MNRRLQLLQVPTGRAVLDLMEPLLRCVAGRGPALLPVPVDDAAAAARLAGVMKPGEPLANWEDGDDDPTALVVATSGSTGSPKGALLPTSALRAGGAAGQHRLGGASTVAGTWLLALPAQHIAGLMVLIRAGLAGTEPQVMDTAAPFDADLFAASTAALPSGPTFVSLVPTQLHRALDGGVGTASLRSYTAVLVGGAATGPALIDRARAAGVSVVTSYGMSETCGGCVYDGVPLDGVGVSLGSPDARVHITGSVVARGYRGLPGHPAFTLGNPRTFHTDDLGSLDRDGSLTVLGRADDVVITGGVKVSPLAVEHALGGISGVAEVAITAIPDPEWGQVLVAIVVPAAGAAPSLVAIRALVSAELGKAAAPRHLLTVDALPTRGPGKLDRVAIAELACAQLPAT